MIRTSVSWFVAPVLIALACGVSAQAYPNKPIRVIVPFSPGSITDILSRMLGEKLTESWRQPVVVENRSGAGSVVGSAIAAKATPDGYTLLMVSNGHAINGSLYKNLSFDPIKDFSGVAEVALVTQVLIVTPSVPATTLRELLALAKAKPGSLNYASAGVGSTAHIAAEMFRREAGVNIVHVPYKGLPEALTDTMTGRVQMYFVGVLAVQQHIQAGRVRALAVTTARRSPGLPDVPTIAEAGLPGFAYDAWFGLLAPARTPRAIVSKLNQEVLRILNLPDIKDRLTRQGAEPVLITPEQFDAVIRTDAARLGKLVQEAGIRID